MLRRLSIPIQLLTEIKDKKILAELEETANRVFHGENKIDLQQCDEITDALHFAKVRESKQGARPYKIAVATHWGDLNSVRRQSIREELATVIPKLNTSGGSILTLGEDIKEKKPDSNYRITSSASTTVGEDQVLDINSKSFTRNLNHFFELVGRRIEILEDKRSKD